MHDAALDELVLGRGLERDEVHAALPAEVAGAQPVELLAGGSHVRPRVVVTLAVEALVDGSWKRKTKLIE